MRVLMTNWVYFPEHAGGALQCHRLTKKLQNMGVEVDVLAGTDRKELRGDSVVDRVPVHRVLRDRKNPVTKMAYAFNLISYIWKNRKKYDILHAHGFLAPVNIASLMTRIPLIQKITNSRLDDPLSIRKRRFGFIYFWIYRIAKLIIPTSTILTKSCEKGLKRTPFKTIPNGVDTESFFPPLGNEKYQLRNKFKIDRDKIILCTVGTVSYLKGTDLLIEALCQLRDNLDEDLVLWIIGPDNYSYGYKMFDKESVDFSRRIHKMVSYYGMDDIVYFLGQQSHINEYLRAADIYVHPSRLEGQPNALLEAMATGLPVVANLLPGITDEIVNPGQCGYVVDCEDISRFAAALKVLINNVELRKRLGQNAREEILKKFDLDFIARQYVETYDQLLCNKTSIPSEPRIVNSSLAEQKN